MYCQQMPRGWALDRRHASLRVCAQSSRSGVLGQHGRLCKASVQTSGARTIWSSREPARPTSPAWTAAAAALLTALAVWKCSTASPAQPACRSWSPHASSTLARLSGAASRASSAAFSKAAPLWGQLKVLGVQSIGPFSAMAAGASLWQSQQVGCHSAAYLVRLGAAGKG